VRRQCLQEGLIRAKTVSSRVCVGASQVFFIKLIKYYLTVLFDFVILYKCYYAYNWNYYLICPCYGNNFKPLDIKEILA
jgi:hypothetical protein